MTNPQEEFEAATKLLLGKFPRERSNKYDDEEWILYERYIPQVLALSKNYANSQTKPNALKPNMDFVNLLVNAAKYTADCSLLLRANLTDLLVLYMITTLQTLSPYSSTLLMTHIRHVPKKDETSSRGHFCNP